MKCESGNNDGESRFGQTATERVVEEAHDGRVGHRSLNGHQAEGHPLLADIMWFTVGLAVWLLLRDALWFVGFMSLYAIWVTHLAGWAAETPV
jgi:hypothetical protein